MGFSCECINKEMFGSSRYTGGIRELGNKDRTNKLKLISPANNGHGLVKPDDGTVVNKMHNVNVSTI